MRHLSFAGGPHYCVGAPLARVLTVTALRARLARFARLELADGTRERVGDFALRGFRGYSSSAAKAERSGGVSRDRPASPQITGHRCGKETPARSAMRAPICSTSWISGHASTNCARPASTTGRPSTITVCTLLASAL